MLKRSTQNLSAIAPLEQAVSDLFKRMQRRPAPDVSVLSADCDRLAEALEQFRQENLVKNSLGFPDKELASLKSSAGKVSLKLKVARYLLALDSEAERSELAAFYTKDYKKPAESALPQDIQVKTTPEPKPATNHVVDADHSASEAKYAKNQGFFAKLSIP